MAKFDIAKAADGIGPEGPTEANDEPVRPRYGFPTDSIRMGGEMSAPGTIDRGNRSQKRGIVGLQRCFRWQLCLAAVIFPTRVHADEPTHVTPDAPPRTSPAPSFSAPLPPTWDLDGIYLWLGPIGTASHVDGQWDSTFGGDIALVRVREHDEIGVLGGTFGAAKWTERGGGRLWLDALVGTPIVGTRMLGVSAGPLLEISDVHHPRIGGSIGAWGFVGVTPFARVGVVQDLGGFVEVGLHVTLPAVRWR